MKYLHCESAKSIADSSSEMLFDNLVWLTSKEAAIYLRKYNKDGNPSLAAIHTAVSRGHLRPRKWHRRLYFKKVELERLLETSHPKRGF